MAICDLSSSLGRLQKATKELVHQWNQTGEVWNDKTRLEFEKRHLQPITPTLRMLMAHGTELIEILQKAERECQDEMTPDA